MTFRSDLGAAALELAGQGHPVLPLHTPMAWGCSCGSSCGSIGKHPRSTYGLHHATTNAEQVEAWWWGQPTANVGMRTDSLLAVDVDGREGERSLQRLEAQLGELPATREQRTGRGRHLLYAVDGASLGNSTRPLGDPPGLDLRAGARGYIVAAPSRHASGSRYAWTDPEAPFAPLPLGWLGRLERALRVVPDPPVDGDSSRTDAYGAAALADELERLLRARPGARNTSLNTSVFRLAQLVAEHRLARRELEQSAFGVALAIGLTPFETQRTIRGALEAGLSSPRLRA